MPVSENSKVISDGVETEIHFPAGWIFKILRHYWGQNAICHKTG